ncbi:uncharacterized protein DUF3768 [Primorskyibacter sedentarius]|uniref:Uncharacterized protein DUF3768 n=1 Tax=Primorskyibacter sedentarius TaxID=745311 RepID=A0A4V2ULD2_9RHOB|nr:DUF3768 domain-containing protein [Primorskyibacter sedentarius]TCS50360.1 uncharacterized protein DUF3768 [Primorskyibacter sedentarius]
MTDAVELTEAEAEAQVIAKQNDQFRKTWGADFTIPGKIVVTQSVACLSAGAQVQIMRAVQAFDTFTEDNDPYGDHSFGAFEIECAGETVKLFWKIDLFDTDFKYGSDAPADTSETRRVLTILQRHEY